MVLKINFSDFWQGFERENNYFFNLLSKSYDLIISSEPEILFYSCYGNEYLRYSCIRIFYTPENMRPDFSGCDFAMTFDYLENPRHFRLPLYILYIEQKKNLENLLVTYSEEQAIKIWESKTKFCCIVVSNSLAKKRIGFYNKLSKYKHVDSGGRYLNNINGPVADKLEFIKDYKFVIAFENSSRSGYTTEKIIEPFMVNSIPIYWGNPNIDSEFNLKRFINYSKAESDEAVIERILEIDGDRQKAINMLMQPCFAGNKLPNSLMEEKVFEFIKHIVDNKDTIHPIAKSLLRIKHSILLKRDIAKHFVFKKMKRNFR